MKNDKLHELRPLYIHETNYRTDNEINLIDLALVLIRRKVMVTSIFAALLVFGTIFTLLTPKTYTFSTTIEIGRQIISGAFQPLERSQSFLAKIKYGYIPQVLIEHRRAYPDNTKKYKITPSTPDSDRGSILLLEIEGYENNAKTLKTLLKTITQIAIQDHNRLYQSVKKSLETSIIETSRRLDALEKSDNSQNEIAEVLTVIEALKFQLSNLRNTRVVLPTVRSIEPIGMSKIVIILIYALAGLLLGILSAFFADFADKLKKL